MRLRDVVVKTALQKHERLSYKYNCNVYLKREDQQIVRSYKIRGAYNKISSLKQSERQKGIACASAGNHAQGVAYSCKQLGLNGHIFMPADTPQQKIDRVASLGGKHVTIYLQGNDFEECVKATQEHCKKYGCVFIPAFDDERVIEGQATIGMEILEDLPKVDYLFMPVGGGGLAAGICYHFRTNSPKTVLIGVEPQGAASMSAAIVAGKPVTLSKINQFIDGAAVRKVGEITYSICKEGLHRLCTIPEGKACATLLQAYNEDGIVTEPAGVLSIAALDEFADELKGKNVVCILSGGNNDSNRMSEIKKMADAWEGLQHYIVVRFSHNPDGLKDFFVAILGKDDYVNRIEYIRRDHGRSTYALLGVRCRNANGFQSIKNRLSRKEVEFKEVEKEDFLFKYWV